MPPIRVLPAVLGLCGGGAVSARQLSAEVKRVAVPVTRATRAIPATDDGTSLSVNRAVVDHGAPRRDMAALRSLAGPDIEVIAALKANAYGHGAVAVARAISAARRSRAPSTSRWTPGWDAWGSRCPARSTSCGASWPCPASAWRASAPISRSATRRGAPGPAGGWERSTPCSASSMRPVSMCRCAKPVPRCWRGSPVGATRSVRAICSTASPRSSRPSLPWRPFARSRRPSSRAEIEAVARRPTLQGVGIP